MKMLLINLCFGIWFLWVLADAKFEDKRVKSGLELAADNPLGVKVNYRVIWLDTKSGQFGGNLTLTLPTSTSRIPYWTIRFIFADQNTIINEYWGEWTMERYKGGSYVILPARESNSSVTSYCFNAQYTGNVKLDTTSVSNLIIPSSYALIVTFSDGLDQKIPLQAQKDYTNTQLDSDIPAAPFGLYIRAPRSQSSPDLDVGDFGDGTTIQNVPVGLYIYGLVFFIGAGIVGVGAFHRSQLRAKYRNQLYLCSETRPNYTAFSFQKLDY